MAGKNGNTKAEQIAASEVASKTGKAWAERFIELAGKNPRNYDLQGWIDDAERLFKGKHDELHDFYAAIQRACVVADSTPRPSVNPFIGDAEKPFSSLFQNVGGDSFGLQFKTFEDERLEAISTQARNAKEAIHMGFSGMGTALGVAADSGELGASAVAEVGWFTASLSDLLEVCNTLEAEAKFQLSLRNVTE